MKANGAGHTVCHRFDIGAIFNDDVDINIDQLVGVIDLDPVGRILYQDIGEAIKQILRGQADYAVSLCDCVVSNGGHCPGSNIDAAVLVLIFFHWSSIMELLIARLGSKLATS